MAQYGPDVRVLVLILDPALEIGLAFSGCDSLGEVCFLAFLLFLRQLPRLDKAAPGVCDQIVELLLGNILIFIGAGSW
jgi:hypothetical protein